MTDAPLPDDTRALLSRPDPAVITTLRADGQPVPVATWYLLDATGSWWTWTRAARGWAAAARD